MSLQETIAAHESTLLRAFQNKDLKVLEEMIHDAAFFILPNGLTLTKAKVIDNYLSGRSVMTEITSIDQVIHLIDDAAVVTFTMHLKGNSLGQAIDSKFRYIRTWKRFGRSWKVIATSGVPILG